MWANLPSPPLSPRPSPPSGEPLPKEDDDSPRRPYTPLPPDIEIRRPYRSFPTTTASVMNIPTNVEGEFNPEMVRHTITMEKMFDEITALEIELAECTDQETYTDEDCIRQFNLDTEIKCLKRRYKLLEAIEDEEFPILPLQLPMESMEDRRHTK